MQARAFSPRRHSKLGCSCSLPALDSQMSPPNSRQKLDIIPLYSHGASCSLPLVNAWRRRHCQARRPQDASQQDSPDGSWNAVGREKGRSSRSEPSPSGRCGEVSQFSSQVCKTCRMTVAQQDSWDIVKRINIQINSSLGTLLSVASVRIQLPFTMTDAAGPIGCRRCPPWP